MSAPWRTGRPGVGSPAPSRAIAIAITTTIALLAGCGVPDDPAPRRLDARSVPFGLLEAAPASSSTTTIPTAATVPVDVFFLGPDGRLRPVVRYVSEPVTVSKVLATLLGGVTEEEAGAGLRSAINPQTRPLTVRVEEGVARVDLNEAFAQAPIQEEIASLAQVVFTATGLPGVFGVRFTLGGAPVEVPKPDNSLAAGPVGRDEFAPLAPEPA